MHLVRLFRIFWAWRLLILIATVASALGGVWVMMTYPPRYEAEAQVELNVLKPDPVTGFVVNAKGMVAYTTSQMQIVRDFEVAARAATALGWMDSPDLQAAYTDGGVANTGMDYPHWVASRIAGSLLVNALPDSNVLVIRFRAPNPEAARSVAEAIRNAYVETSLEAARNSAAGAAAGQQQLAEVASAKLIELAERRTDLERETGLTLQKDTDVDSDRLKAMASTVPIRAPVTVHGVTSATAAKLAEADSALEAATKVLGPNHPSLISMRARRASLAEQVAMERTSGNSVATDMLSSQRAEASLMAAQVSKVIAQRPDVTKLRLLQDEITSWQTRYQAFNTGAQEQKQLANLATTAVKPLGPIETPKKPIFPNPSLIMGGSVGLGLALGILMAVMAELMNRRVRVPRDLKQISHGPAFVAVPRAHFAGARAAKPRRSARTKQPRVKQPRVKEPRGRKARRAAGLVGAEQAAQQSR